MTDKENFMRLCLELARIALERGDAPVGSLIVLSGKIIAGGIEYSDLLHGFCSARAYNSERIKSQIILLLSAAKGTFSREIVERNATCKDIDYFTARKKLPERKFSFLIRPPEDYEPYRTNFDGTQ